MTHVEIIYTREKQTDQLDHRAPEAASIQRSSGARVNRSLRRLPTASLPLRARCTTSHLSVACTGAEDRLYRQTAAKLDLSAAGVGQLDRPIDQRFDHTSARTFSSQTWLNDIPTRKFKWNTAMIAWRNASLASFMKVCFRSVSAFRMISLTTSLK